MLEMRKMYFVHAQSIHALLTWRNVAQMRGAFQFGGDL
jgi:hypothetical protein